MKETYTAHVTGTDRDDCARLAIEEAKTYFGNEADLEVAAVSAERVPNPDADYDSPTWLIKAEVTIEAKRNNSPFRIL